jgi:hypothetical protein
MVLSYPETSLLLDLQNPRDISYFGIITPTPTDHDIYVMLHALLIIKFYELSDVLNRILSLC